MPLRIHDLSFSFAAEAPLLDGLTVDLGPGWTGVVGANGRGKSTLLRLIAGELTPDGGHVRGGPVVRCPQRIPQQAVRPRGVAWHALAGRLHLQTDQLERWPTLSPGEQRRWQLADALAARPPVLLLDEPTNHLDAQGRAWLVEVLRRFDGVGLLVSHDRALLDELTCRTLRLGPEGARLWHGGYSAARAGWEAEARDGRLARQRLRREQDRVGRRLVARREQHRQAGARHRRTLRRAGHADHDARSMAARGKAINGDRRLSREIERTRGRFERLDAALAPAGPRELGANVSFAARPVPASWGLTLAPTRLRTGVAVPRLVLEPRMRVHLAGANGAGKTTLLRALLGAGGRGADELLYLPQALPEDGGRQQLAELRQLPADLRGRVLAIVAALGVDPARLLASRAPSPGEARKLALAQGLGRGVWCLVLDEPTNHLDLPSIERLEAALAAYDGALLLVTHDAQLAGAVTESVWSLTREGLQIDGR